MDDADGTDVSSLISVLKATASQQRTGQSGDQDAFTLEDRQEETAVSELREKLRDLKVVARAKVTQDRIYSVAYHPERSKDLVFFGGMSMLTHEYQHTLRSVNNR